MPLLRLGGRLLQLRRVRDECHATIRVAEGLAPVVLWIDELEKGFMSMAELGGGQAFGTSDVDAGEGRAGVRGRG